MTAFLVTGDAARNKIQTMPGGGTATIKIELPENWNELMAKLGYEPLKKYELDATLIPPPSKTPGNESVSERRRQGGADSNSRRSGKGKSRNRQDGSYDRRDQGGQGGNRQQYRRPQGGESGDRQGRGGQGNRGSSGDRPQFSEETRKLAAACRRDPSKENRAALKKQIGVDYDRFLEEQRAKLKKGKGGRKSQESRRLDAMKHDRAKRIEAIMERMLDPQGGQGNRDRRGR